jgi:hypothetical protein
MAAFALLLVLKAFFVGLLSFGTRVDDLAIVLRMYFAIGIPFAALYFARVVQVHYQTERSKAAHWPYALVLAAMAASFLILFALRRDLYRDAAGAAGPLVLFQPLSYAAFAFIAVFFATMALRRKEGLPRNALLLVGLALCMEPLHQTAFNVLNTFTSLATGWTTLEEYARSPFFLLERAVWILLGGFFLWFALRLLQLSKKGDASLRRHARWSLIVLLLPVFTGLLSLGAVLSDRAFRTSSFMDLHFALDAIWVLVGAGIIVYAILHHHFLDRPRRLRRAVRTSTVVGASLVLFFFAQEILEEVVQGRFPPLPGLAAAVVAAILVYPVMVAITRFIRAVMPTGLPLEELKLDERRAIYASQVELVWMDGVVTKVERRLLDRMRERLRLSEEIARRIEESVFAHVQEPASDTAGAGSGGRRPRVPSS